jgi:hypothetical protein
MHERPRLKARKKTTRDCNKHSFRASQKRTIHKLKIKLKLKLKPKPKVVVSAEVDSRDDSYRWWAAVWAPVPRAALPD